MMEQNPFPEERMKREEGRQAQEPQPEPGGTSKSGWNRTSFLRKERREKKGDKHRNQRRENKGDKHRNPSRNQEEPANHDGTEPLFSEERKKREEGRQAPEPKKREGRQAPEPQPEPGGTSKS